MVLAGVLLKLGIYGLLRFSFLFPFFFYELGSYLVSVGLIGGLLSCFLCLRQMDLKSFVAYSSICHMGFCLGGVYSFSFFGMEGGIFILIRHGFCSSCLFYLLYVIYKRYYSRSGLVLKGVLFLFPLIGMVGFVFSVLNMGVPPSFSFFSEVFILSGVLGTSLFGVFFVGFFLFLCGLYGIYLYVVFGHGVSVLGGHPFFLFVKEYLLFFGHFFPVLILGICLGFFL
jgi:NADH:ubiquinone oxidoreductase subunit 4 (subunit M)